MPINAFIAIEKAIDQKGVGRNFKRKHLVTYLGTGRILQLLGSFKRSPKLGKEGANPPVLTEDLTSRLLGVRVNLPATGKEEPEENPIASE